MKNIEVNGKKYKVSIADTDELREQGLQNVSALPKKEGMLFIFDEPCKACFWMKDTLIPLDIIYIDEYGEVQNVFKGDPESEKMFEAQDIKYVLELNIDSGVKVGDDVDLSEVEPEDETVQEDEEEEEDTEKLHVVGPDGNTQMELDGGERIFSRPNTKTLVKLSKKAYKSKTDKDYKALGRKVFKYIDTQNTNEEQYVEIKKS